MFVYKAKRNRQHVIKPIKGQDMRCIIPTRDVPIPKIGETRTVTKFLWWPTTIKEELRWMERATIKQEYNPGIGINGVIINWINMEWLD